MRLYPILLSLSVLLFGSLIEKSDGYKILVTTVGLSGSQNLIMYRLADLLGARDNEVTLLNANFLPEARRVPLKHAREVNYDLVDDKAVLDSIRVQMSHMPWENGPQITTMVPLLRNVFAQVLIGCERFITDKNNDLLKELYASKFDVLVIHMADFCSFGLARRMGIKSVIWMSTAFLIDPMAAASGVPYPISYVPSAAHAVTDKMNYPQRMKNLLASALVHGMPATFIYSQFTAMFRKHFGPDFPSLPELLADTQLFFVNSDAFFEFPRPLLPNIVYVGGLTMKKADPLTDDWLKVMQDEAYEGVVLFSMGTVVNTTLMPGSYRTAFVNAFKRFPKYRFIFRIDGDLTQAKKVKNIVLTKWVPQKDLLAHDKLKAFITHGGYNSLTEATYHGVPLVMLPFFGDQYANVKRVERLGIGVSLDRFDLTEQKVYDALNTVLSDNELQASACRLGKMIRNKPVSSLDLALNWVEFLAEYKDLDMLKVEARNLNPIQYYSIDTVGTVVLVILAVLYVVFRCCSAAFSFCCKKRQKPKQN